MYEILRVEIVFVGHPSYYRISGTVLQSVNWNTWIKILLDGTHARIAFKNFHFGARHQHFADTEVNIRR